MLAGGGSHYMVNNMSFEFLKTEIPDVILIKPQTHVDQRGFFLESYRKDEFQKAGIATEFVQDNHSKSIYGVLRGLHFQKKPYEQAKLVRCVRGKIFDVAVDLRENSKTYGKYVSAILSEKNKEMLFIPRGFAHGFLVLSTSAEVLYKTDNIYSKASESGIIWNDVTINIPWPIKNPILSEKDKSWHSLE